MPQISDEKRKKIAEQILFLLYNNFPESLFTAKISQELARDEEFIKAMMLELKNKGLVLDIKKNPKGVFYTRRIRWRLTNKVHDLYKNKL